MPRPPARKKTTARPAPAARNHSTASISKGETFNGRVEDDGIIVDTEDELPQPTVLRRRVSRAASKKIHADAQSENLERIASVETNDATTSRAVTEPIAPPVAGEGPTNAQGDKGGLGETLVAATPDPFPQNDVVAGSSRSVAESDAEASAETGRRSKRVKNKATNLIRRVSTSGVNVLRKVSPPSVLLSQEARIPSSPPVQQQVAAPQSAARIAATPSFLRNFKKQPRQPSILHMVQQDVAGFEDGEEDLTIEGNTELLGHTTIASEARSQSEEAQNDEGLYDEEDALPAMSSSSRKRKASELDPEERHTIRSSIRGSKVDGIELDPPSDPANLPHTTIEHSSEADDLTPDDSASLRPPRSSPPIEEDRQSERLPSPRRGRRPPRPGRMLSRKTFRSLKVAEPKSSSSVIDASSPQSTPPSSPVNTQAPKGRSKNVATTRKGAKRDKVVAITTAALQALLPRRKVVKAARQHDPFDIHSSSTSELAEDVDEDEDELSRPHRRRAPVLAAGRGKPGALRSPTKVTKSKAQSKSMLAGLVAAKHGKSSAKTVATKVGARTYGRKSQGGQENEHDHDQDDGEEITTVVDVDAPTSSGPGGELKDAKKKFAQVDEWELEFESADVGGGNSSPWR
jgi:hypothetical protein